jgi:2-succinyl-6-hydroxy-2,4-cyclohexadiene-1-carboxylate synthase
MPTITVLGVPHAYDLTAPTQSPDVLVFIHGWMLSRSYWKPLIGRLAPEYQCLSYDLRGFGDSQLRHQSLQNLALRLRAEQGSVAVADPPSISSYSLQSYAKDLEALLQQLNISRAWLVGHSLGGYIALWGAQRLPEQVKGVICLNSGGGIYVKEAFERFRSAGEQMVKLRPRWLAQVPYLDLVFSKANVVNSIDRAWGRQRLIDFVRADRAAAIGTLLDSTTEAEVHRLPQVVSRLHQPVHFIAGAKDSVMELKYVRHLASFHSSFCHCGDNVFEIPDCGHLSMLEKLDVVSDKIQAIVAD